MAYEFKKLSAVEAVEVVGDDASVLIEENGVIKRAPKDEVGGIKVASTAEVGQTIVVKAVDAEGKPTEWECADMIFVVHVQETSDSGFYTKETFEEVSAAADEGKTILLNLFGYKSYPCTAMLSSKDESVIHFVGFDGTATDSMCMRLYSLSDTGHCTISAIQWWT